jgi:hypothetical protein
MNSNKLKVVECTKYGTEVLAQFGNTGFNNRNLLKPVADKY